MDEQRSNKQQVEYFLGTITEIIDPLLYIVKCDIPGEFDGITAFAKRSENTDEPRVGDFVLLMSFDPIYHSYWIYEKLKENDYIGIRSNGKMVNVTPDFIEMAIFDPEEEWGDDQGDEKYRPEPTSWVNLDKDGNLDIALNTDNSNITISVGGTADVEINGACNITLGDNCNVTIQGNGKIVTKGNAEIKSEGNTTITANANCKVESRGSMEVKGGSSLTCSAPSITLKGPGTLKCSGTPIPGKPGPFMVPAVAPAPGTPNITTDTVILT